MLRPIRFEDYVEVHFDDISTYGSVSPSRHLDYVITTRWKCFQKVHGVSAQAVSKKSFAFPIVHFEIDYLSPIRDIERLKVESLVESIQAEYLHIPFSITSEDGTRVYSRGKITSVCVDPATGQPREPTEEAVRFFYEER